MSKTHLQFLRNDLLLLCAVALCLPFVPDRAMGPLEAFNPYRIWLIVTLLLAIGSIGQLASALMGAQRGMPLAGFVSGFVSSTATILALGLQVKKQPSSHAPAVAAAVLSGVATYLQMSLLLLALSRPLFTDSLAAMALGALASALYSLYFIQRSARSQSVDIPAAKSFISLRAALGLAGMIALISFVVVALNHYIGEKGVWLGAALAGLTDAHAAGASVAALVNDGKLQSNAALIAVMLGMTTNTGLRMALAASLGSHLYARELIPGLGIGLLAAWAGALAVLL